jgi:hypothetical protein
MKQHAVPICRKNPHAVKKITNNKKGCQPLNESAGD